MMTAESSAPRPSVLTSSCTTSTRFVLSSDWKIASLSYGFSVRRSITSTSTPCFERRAAAVPVAQRRRLVDDLIEPARDEIGKLHLRDRPVAAQRRADADADNRRFRDGRVDHPHVSELVVEPLRHAERAAVRADVFAEH